MVCSVGLSQTDFLFLNFRSEGRGNLISLNRLSVAYFSVVAQLKFCDRLVPELFTLHSGRIGAATVAAEVGMSKEMIRVCEVWKGDTIDV